MASVKPEQDRKGATLCPGHSGSQDNMAAFLLAVLPFIVAPGDTTHRIGEQPVRAPSFRAAPAIVLMCFAGFLATPAFRRG